MVTFSLIIQMQVQINIWQLFDAIENVQGKVRADFFSVCFVPRTIRIAFHGLAGIPICFFGNLMEIFFPERKKSSTENLLTSRTIPVFATNGFTTTGSGIEFHSFASSPLSDLVTLKSDKSSVFTDKTVTSDSDSTLLLCDSRSTSKPRNSSPSLSDSPLQRQHVEISTIEFLKNLCEHRP